MANMYNIVSIKKQMIYYEEWSGGYAKYKTYFRFEKLYSSNQ